MNDKTVGVFITEVLWTIAVFIAVVFVIKVAKATSRGFVSAWQSVTK